MHKSTLPPPYLSPMRSVVLIMAAVLPIFLLAQGETRQERKVRAQLAKGKAYPAIRISSGMLGKGDHPEFYALRAEGYNSIAEHAKAEADARMAIRLLPDSVSGLYQLALAEQGFGRLDSAPYLRMVLNAHPAPRSVTAWPWWSKCRGTCPKGCGRSTRHWPRWMPLLPPPLGSTV